MTKDYFYTLLGIREAYKMPDRLFEILKEKKRAVELMEKISETEDLSSDFMRDYFQSEHADRQNLKQDYTPHAICELLAEITERGEKTERYADICAGTGALTIAQWCRNKDAFFYCEEYSERVVPVLLLNLAVRGINGQVIQGNSLTGQADKIFNLKREGKFSTITETEEKCKEKFDVVITNPPYSMPWKEVDEYKYDERFIKYGLPPASKADYAFILHAVSKMKEGGRTIAIVPYGTLFRGSKEKDIRENLLKSKMVESVIGLPDKLFMNTAIPVCLLVFREKSDTTYIIDADKDYKPDKKQNIMQQEHIHKISEAYRNKWNIERYSRMVSQREIEENDYNLNIPRYIDTFEPEPVPDLIDCVSELAEIEKEIRVTELKLFEMVTQLEATGKKREELDFMIEAFIKNI